MNQKLKGNKDNNTFQKIKDTILKDKDKKIVVVQKKNKKRGNYILEETIGEGAFAKVKLARHIQTGEKVAIKIINKEEMYNFDIKKIKKEINILQRLKHKNIIQLYEIMETHKNLYIVMEYCEGKELFEYIVKRKHLTEREACRYFQQLINGVEYLHLSNITHRDLKPENLLLDNKKRILITDFGLSILSEKYNEQLSTPCGTPSYSPPEMLKGRKYNGVYSDIWSCGIILYTMLVGNLPCSESKEELLYQNIITHNFYYPENLSDDAIDLIEHLLKINPEERYNFDEIKVHPWFNLLTPKLRPGIIFKVHKIPIDPKILDKVEEYGYNREKVEESVSKSKYDSLSAVYYLILKRFKKDGINSVSDLFSEDYMNYLKNPKNWLTQNKISDPLFKNYEVEILSNYDDELLWIPNELSKDMFNIVNVEENNIKSINIKESVEEKDKNNELNNITEENLEKKLLNDNLVNDLKINVNSKNNNDNNTNIEHNKSRTSQNLNEDKINLKKNLNNYLNKKEKITNARNVNMEMMKKKYIINISRTNCKENKNKNNKSYFNLKNKNKPLSLEKIIKDGILKEKENDLETITQKNNNLIKKDTNSLNNFLEKNNFSQSIIQTLNLDANKTSSKSFGINSPETIKINKNIKSLVSPERTTYNFNSNKQGSFNEIIFDNLNELEAESKLLSQASILLNDNISEKRTVLNKIEENDKNRIKITISPLRSIVTANRNAPFLTNKKSKNSLSKLLYTNSSNRSGNLKVRNTSRDKLSIRIKRAKTKNKEKNILLAEELEQKKKEEIISKLKEEEKKFDEELNAIDNIPAYNTSNNINNSISINYNTKQKSLIGQIAEKLIKTTIFSKYLIGHKKMKEHLKDDLENKFYILQKYKNIIGLIERMRNKIFTKKLNDFNFYTFDEYLNDENDKMIVKSILKIPYFNSFIQKAKNTLYQKEAMTKRSYSKNFIIKPRKFNLNNNPILSYHLSTNSNNLYYTFNDFHKLGIKQGGIKGLNLNLSFSQDKFITNQNDRTNNFNLYKKGPQSTKGSGKHFVYSKIKYKHHNKDKNKTLNETDNLKTVEVRQKRSSSINNKNFNQNYRISYNRNILSDKEYINDISEDEESGSSYSSMSQEKKNYNIKGKSTGKFLNTQNKKIYNSNEINPLKTRKIYDEDKLNNVNFYKNKNKTPKNIKSKKVSYSKDKFQSPTHNNNNKNKIQMINNQKEKEKDKDKDKQKEKEKDKNEEEESLINKANTFNSNIDKKNDIIALKELKELIPIDINNILFFPITAVINKTKKYFKKYGYFCNQKSNIIKANKGSSNIEITLYKLIYLSQDSIYFSVKIKSKDLKNEKLFINELIYNLNK